MLLPFYTAATECLLHSMTLFFFETIDMIILLLHLRHIPTYVFRIEFFAITSENLHSNYYLRTIKIVCDPIIQAIIIWQNTSTLYLVAY